jgi:hypothetical protein
MGWLIILAVAVILILWFAFRSPGWTTVLISSEGSDDQLEEKFEYLKSNQVKCRLATETQPDTGADGKPLMKGETKITKLMVRDNDLERAHILLEQFSQGTKYY